MMKCICSSLILIIIGCNGNEEVLVPEEIARIQSEIIQQSEKNGRDLLNKDFNQVMGFYANDTNFFLFGDGYYWGDHETVREIWKGFLGDSDREMLRWDLKNHKVKVSSTNTASYLVEYYSERIEPNGDTIKVKGSLSYGMERINQKWKAVTMNITHNYQAGYGHEQFYAGFDAEKNNRNWWKAFSPEQRKSKQ